MQLLWILSTVVLALLVRPWISYFKNYRTVKNLKAGLPVLSTPIGSQNPLYALTRDYVYPWIKHLPFGLGDWVDYTGFAWYFEDRGNLHTRLGPAFFVVSPSEVQLVVADADLVDKIIHDRLAFPKESPESMNFFGPNLVTAPNEPWGRQRRLTTPPFNERNSNFVWQESLMQATDMMEDWTSRVKDGVMETTVDAMTLTLHVLIAAGLGRRYDFNGGSGDLAEGYTLSYRDSLKYLISNFILCAIVKPINLPLSLLPATMRKVKTALVEFESYMQEMIEEKRQAPNVSEEKDNLLTALLRAQDSKESNGRNGLTDGEVMGNLFMFNIAGHDTTANTIAYSVYLLSVNPEIQDWLREEINFVFGAESDVSDWNYQKSWPRLKRCLAVMNETLRLYGPVAVNPRRVEGNQTVTINNKSYTLPANTNIMINVAALGYLEQYWGPNSRAWEPRKFVTPSTTGSLDDESVWQPDHKAFIPFSTGPRVCPGKKFAQVEVLAVFARLFRKHRCMPVLEVGETMEMARKRVLEVVDDSNLVLTLKMLHPERVKIRWEEV